MFMKFHLALEPIYTDHGVTDDFTIRSKALFSGTFRVV